MVGNPQWTDPSLSQELKTLRLFLLGNISHLNDCELSSHAVFIPRVYTPVGENVTKESAQNIFMHGRLRQNYVITKKSIPQELFCVIGGCRDLRLFHVELRDRMFLRK